MLEEVVKEAQQQSGDGDHVRVGVLSQVPKYRVEYLEKVVEVQSQVLPQARKPAVLQQLT